MHRALVSYYLLTRDHIKKYQMRLLKLTIINRYVNLLTINDDRQQIETTSIYQSKYFVCINV